jgi:hypothetical protein
MLVRVPWKPAARGARTSAIVEHVDLYPSLAELAGVPVDPVVESIDGVSWASLLDDPSGKSGHTKLAAYSQFPRCYPKLDPTYTPADYDRMVRCLPTRSTGTTRNMSFMGLSIRTKDYRFTEWHAWQGGEILRPDWDDGSQMIELYDHRTDPPHSSKISFEQFENVNIAHAAGNKGLVKELGQQLREFFEKERKPKPSPPPPPPPPSPSPTPSCPVVKVDCYWNGSPANPAASVHATSWAECCARCGSERGCAKWVFRGAQPSGNNCMLHSNNATTQSAPAHSGVVCGELARRQ